jgi:hypothetical protein
MNFSISAYRIEVTPLSLKFIMIIFVSRASNIDSNSCSGNCIHWLSHGTGLTIFVSSPRIRFSELDPQYSICGRGQIKPAKLNPGKRIYSKELT